MSGALPGYEAPVSLRIVLAVDLEPDPRLPVSADDSHWDGFRASRVLAQRIRELLRSTQSEAPAFTWLVRMDEQIRQVYGHCGFVTDRFARELDDLEREGDDVGIHTHLFRWEEGQWITDYASTDWMRHCVEGAAEAFRATRGQAPRLHSFGDRYFSSEAASVLDELGFHVDMSVEPGFFPLDRVQEAERLLGRMPDFTRAPRSLWRPSHADYLCEDEENGRTLRLLPVTTYRFPLWMEPGRRAEHLLRRSRGDAPGEDERLQRYARVGCSQRGYVFRNGMKRALAEGAPSTLHFVLRANQAKDAATCERVVENLRWLVQGGVGQPVEFLPASRLQNGDRH